MFIASLALAASLLVLPAEAGRNKTDGGSQQPAEPPKPELAVLKANLGTCSADFTVKGADGKPVYAATIHVRVRYGMLGVKRADLEVGTNSDGKARIEGLPGKARPLAYDIHKGEKKAAVEQNVADTCRGTYDVTLK